MIKKFFLIFASLVFAVGILGVSVVRTTAQTSTKFKITPLANVSPSPAATPTPAKVDYYLAYPGILPDHFLYSIKMVRDRVLLFFTSESLKKAELLLLFADKRLGAGQALIEGGKAELGVSTLTKAEKYLERAIEQAKVAKNAGKDTTAFYEKLRGATLKHQEVLGGVEQKVPEQAKPFIEELKKYSRAGYESVTGEEMNK